MSQRFYRVETKGLKSFHLTVKQTDLWISAKEDLKKEALDLVLELRHQLEDYISQNPDFLTTLSPYPEDPFASPLVKEMIRCSKPANVGPMASVAGAIAQFVGEGLLTYSDEVIVENGGDIFIKLKRPATISIYAGASPLSMKLGIRLSPERMPSGVCSSSGTVGHSFSTGKADCVCVISGSASLSDASATSICNQLKKKSDLQKAPLLSSKIPGLTGGLAIMGDTLSVWGDVEIVRL